MGLVLASPPITPAPATSWGGVGVVWEGPDGSIWDLTDAAGGVLLLKDRVEGLHFPRITKWSSQSRAIPGKRLRGWQAQSRDVFWPLFVWGDGSDAWLDVQRRFFRTIHPENAGTWRVTAGGSTRTLRCTGVFDDAYAHDHDPLAAGWALYGVTLEAVQPYWAGPSISRGPWGPPAGVDFIQGTAPPMYVSSSKTRGSAEINNPGDVPAWPVWGATGELDEGTELGIGGSTFRIPFAIDEGQVLRIDTDPRNPTATLDGVDMTAPLGLVDFAPIPPGGSVPLSVVASGAGTISCSLTPLYFRAF